MKHNRATHSGANDLGVRIPGSMNYSKSWRIDIQCVTAIKLEGNFHGSFINSQEVYAKASLDGTIRASVIGLQE